MGRIAAPDPDLVDASEPGPAALSMEVVGVIGAPESWLPELALEDRKRVERYVGRASAEATLRAYRLDWQLFVAWCAESGYCALPGAPATVAGFLTLGRTPGLRLAAAGAWQRRSAGRQSAADSPRFSSLTARPGSIRRLFSLTQRDSTRRCA